MEIDVAKEIRRAVDTGKVVFGYRQAEKNILKAKGQIVIVSKNAPQQLSEKARELSQIAQIPFFEAKKTALELGSICGKPFLVSTLLVLDKGKSKVLEIMQEEKPKLAPARKKRKPVTKKTRMKKKPVQTKQKHRKKSHTKKTKTKKRR